MHITINGESNELDEADVNLARLLEIKRVESPEMIAVQLNGEFVDMESYPSINLKAGDEVSIFLVQGSETATPTTVLTITQCLLLSVEKIAAGQAVEGQAAGEETPPPESKTLIVAAIPRADEQKFIMWLPSSHVILSVGTKR